MVAEEGLAVSVTPERPPQGRCWTCQGLPYRGGPYRPIQRRTFRRTTLDPSQERLPSPCARSCASSEATLRRRLRGRCELCFAGTTAHLAFPAAFADLPAQLKSYDWVVYAKTPFAGPEQLLAYWGRYTQSLILTFHPSNTS
ncbi:MAG: transposase [Pyrinomonadaceae bacterium]